MPSPLWGEGGRQAGEGSSPVHQWDNAIAKRPGRASALGYWIAPWVTAPLVAGAAGAAAVGASADGAVAVSLAGSGGGGGTRTQSSPLQMILLRMQPLSRILFGPSTST